jgi:hypothetical protein
MAISTYYSGNGGAKFSRKDLGSAHETHEYTRKGFADKKSQIAFVSLVCSENDEIRMTNVDAVAGWIDAPPPDAQTVRTKDRRS